MLKDIMTTDARFEQLRKENEALKILLRVYERNHDCCPCGTCRDDARADVNVAKEEYERTMKDNG